MQTKIKFCIALIFALPLELSEGKFNLTSVQLMFLTKAPKKLNKYILQYCSIIENHIDILGFYDLNGIIVFL